MKKLLLFAAVLSIGLSGICQGGAGSAFRWVTADTTGKAQGALSYWDVATARFKLVTVLPVANGGTGVNTLTGIAKGNGTSAFTAAIAADFPTLNQNTTGSAATLTTSRNIFGYAFNGSANITLTLPSARDSSLTPAPTRYIDQQFYEGLYVPVASNLTNCTVTTATLYFTRVMNTVFVKGFITPSVTTGLTATSFQITLPLKSSNFSTESEASGGGFVNTYTWRVHIVSGTTRVQFDATPPTTGGQSTNVQFSFQLP